MDYSASGRAFDVSSPNTVRGKVNTCPHRLCFRAAGEPEPELPVDLGLVGRLGVAEHGVDVAERRHQVRDSGSVIRRGLLPAIAGRSVPARARSVLVGRLIR
ncbi:hypothetical protein [Micromonospora sp. NPDC023644]|uniref:hypothetical protein n=1 Tax=Micromonospora sp. NPDC023644 TaxID=3154321 RepID=UPI0033F6624C